MSFHFSRILSHSRDQTLFQRTVYTVMSSIFLAVLVPVVLLFLIYMLLVWLSTCRQRNGPVKAEPVKGLSAADLEKLPKVTGKELVMGDECVICLDEIESHEPVRLLPVCHHGFHLQCADAWLSRSPVCPICRVKLERQLFTDSNDVSPC